MATGLLLPVSGPYIGSFNADDLGTLDDNGFELSMTMKAQEINETDAYGMTLVEAIIRGQDWRCRIVGREFEVGLVNALQMFGGLSSGNLTPHLANIGDTFTRFAKVLLLNAVLGDPPTSPTSLTASLACLSPNNQSAMNFTSKIRDMPIELVLLPYGVTVLGQPKVVPFTIT